MSSRTEPGVTVVIPTFNRKDWLKIAIDSVLAETRVPLRLHVFDNASSDGTMEFMQSLALKNDNLVYTRNTENIGAHGNYARALDHVRTRYFIPLADDDFLLPDFVFDAIQILEDDRSLGAAVFVTEARGADGSVRNTYPRGLDKVQPGRMEPAEHLRSWMNNGHYSWSSILWRSETLDFVGYPYLHTGLPSDVDFQAQVFCKYPAVFVNTPGAVYRLHMEQAGWSVDASTLMSWASLFRRLDRRVMEFGILPLEEYAQLRNVMAERYRQLWRRRSKQPLSESVLERMAVAAGFRLGDWEFAFSLVDELKERPAASRSRDRLVQIPNIYEDGKLGATSALRVGPSPIMAVLTALRQYQSAARSQAEEVEGLRARYAALEQSLAKASAPHPSPSGAASREPGARSSSNAKEGQVSRERDKSGMSENEDLVRSIRSLRPVDIYKDFRSGVTESEFRARCGNQAVWHSVDLGDTFVEGARKTSAVLEKEMRLMDWPDVRGKSVLDIGAFGGWFSFEAERRGASSVTAIDYYSWCYDWAKIHQWVRGERAAGRVPDTYNPPEQTIDRERQPGRRAFDVTKEILGSKVTPILTQSEEFKSDPFDIVLYLGVLYHAKNPFYSLQKAADLCKECLIVETLGVHLPGQEDRAVWEFFNSDQVNGDVTTWWAPNEAGLRDMLIAAGFANVEIKAGVDQLTDAQKSRRSLVRIWAHARRTPN